MMEIVIKIPEEMYRWVCDVNKFSNDYGTGDFIDLIKNGMPLPKGHGRLIDADAMQNYQIDTFGQRLLVIDTAPTIIEADGGGTNEASD